MNSDQRKEALLKEMDYENELQFAAPQSVQQADMLEYLKGLSETERTELLGELYTLAETQRNEEMLIGGKAE